MKPTMSEPAAKQELLAQLPPFEPLSWLAGGNLQTLYAKSLQSAAPPYRRELLPDRFGTGRVAYDFIDADDQDAPLVMLFHGLEGSSRSHYAVALMNAVRARGWHGVVAHFPTCGGVPARRMYHSGDTPEAAHMLQLMAARYETVYAAGVSMGGNILAKYLGEQGRRSQAAVPRAAAVVSAPLDLPAAGAALSHGLPKLLYTRYFLNTMLPKIEAWTGAPPVHKIRSLADFDHYYTAPLNGFAGKDDYYRRAASKPYLKDIAVPTLVLNAQNDPFLPGRFLPGEAEVSPQVYLLQPANGGHVGFVSGRGRGHLNWLPAALLRFFELAA
ncbi:alpha/beta fold hydrolase [Neisseria leonii]|uniref:YheT family hydrolase n=1 Tax=Neisseria leonii TaxID=2995413 RepID=UPI0030D06870